MRPIVANPRWTIAIGLGAFALLTGALTLTAADREPERTLLLRPVGNATGAATARIHEFEAGRIVELRIDEPLRALPPGWFHELWLLSPDDAPGRPRRVSAGTFTVRRGDMPTLPLSVGADPARYPIASVTAEPGDGDPRPSGRELLRSGGAG